MAGQDIALLNTIRDNASTSYQDRIPLATRDNITAIGNAILNYSPAFEEFTGLLNKIGKTVVASKMANNKLAKFKKGELPFGTDVEEIFVEMAQSEGAYDPTGANPLGRRKPEILANYHRENRQDKYVVSVSETQVKRAFTNGAGVTSLVNDIANSIYSGDNYDEYILMKELLAQYKDNYYNIEVPSINETNGLESSVKDLVRAVRKSVSDLSYVSTNYNKAGVKTYSEKQDLVLLVHKDVLAHTDVDVLAKAFNMGKTDFEPTIVEVDDFGSMSDTYALLVDKDFFMVWDVLYKTTDQYNAEGLFNNLFLHHHQILSLSQYKNAVRFTDDATTVA